MEISFERWSRAPSVERPIRDVLATCSNRSPTGSALESISSRVALSASSNPLTRISGCNPLSSSLPASLISSLASKMQPVTPSPQAFSWLSARLTNAFAAGCLTNNSATILAPSFVTAASPLVLYNILSNPFGPNVPRRTLPNAIAAPTSFCVTPMPLVTEVEELVILTGAVPEPSGACAMIRRECRAFINPSFT